MCGDTVSVDGCMNPLAFANYDETATIRGRCIPAIRGCTDSTALNYVDIAVPFINLWPCLAIN